MANQNLFEKYGIRDVADVTFYKIDRKMEAYESQRKISISSVLKGAVELKTVYPLVDGIGAEEGFEAYVFTKANLLTGANYDCDADSELTSEVGTHEYSYAEQALMLFAKSQNLITKSGVRYQFTNTDLFGAFTFSDEFAAAPNSTEKLVVLIYSGKNTENTYDLEEVQTQISALTTTYTAKAYDVTYRDYAELLVEDEMGYYNPSFLGSTYTETADGGYNIEDAYNGSDVILSAATMWGADQHKSINDAIEALRQKKQSLDGAEASSLAGLNSISGGYNVNVIGSSNGTDEAGEYSYNDTEDSTSNYTLQGVLDALSSIALTEETVKDLVATDNSTASNRAIYVKVDGSVDTSASAYIYLLRNKNYKKLALDTSGMFVFEDRNGATCYYKDTIFAGKEYLALVIIGNQGLIFSVGRCGTKKIEKIAWMINDNGYITNSQCDTLVKNGIIHTTDVTVENETFEATCTVSGLKVRTTTKKVLHYTPVLFLDSLKVTTLEQTAEQTSATGGHGNGQLITWDFNKEITLSIEDALYTPASMSLMMGTGSDFTSGVKEAKKIDRTEKCVAKRSFIVPAGNSNGIPSEGETTAQAVYIDLATMQPYQDGAPIAEGEVYLKWTRSVAYGNNSLGSVIEISADKFPGTYKVVGDTFARNKVTGEDQRFQFVIPQAKMGSEQTITLEADGDPVIFNMTLNVLRPEDGVMIKFIQYDVVDNEEENDGSTMIKGTENLNLLDDAEMFRVSDTGEDEVEYIGATEY